MAKSIKWLFSEMLHYKAQHLLFYGDIPTFVNNTDNFLACFVLLCDTCFFTLNEGYKLRSSEIHFDLKRMK